MKATNIITTTLALVLAAAPSVFAAGNTTKVYNSGILVLAFLGFCALVVVIQLIPAIITLCGMLKGLAKRTETRPSRVRVGK